jgi:hypothetical protein
VRTFASKDELFRRAKTPSLCGAHSLRGTSLDGKETRFHRLNCRCWDCSYCGPKRAARYKYAIRDAATELRLTRFLTLTLDPKKVTGDPVVYLRECWNKFRVYLRRGYGESPKFIAVLEFQKEKPGNPGLPHLHILTDRFIHQEWIKRTWQKIGGGMHVDIRLVDLHRVANYLSKYLTKDLLLSAPKRTRRVTTSRGICLNKKTEKKHRWVRLRAPINRLYEMYAAHALDLEYDEDEMLRSFVVRQEGALLVVNLSGFGNVS